jgi:8-oxo-dGTP pyrophosphatase MutT (NUDIX family)
MDWTVHGERTLYQSYWVSFGLIDVELPTGRRFDHEVLRAPSPSAGTVVYSPDKGVLLLWRHRFIPDSRGWEVPAGRVEVGETPETGAAREVLEETGWRPGPLQPLFDYNPSSGIFDQSFHVFFADCAEEVGAPVDWFEADLVRWVPVDEVRAELSRGHIHDGLTATALSWCFAVGPLSTLSR